MNCSEALRFIGGCSSIRNAPRSAAHPGWSTEPFMVGPAIVANFLLRIDAEEFRFMSCLESPCADQRQERYDARLNVLRRAGAGGSIRQTDACRIGIHTV